MKPDFEKLYFQLFNRVTDSIQAIPPGVADQARNMLIQAQKDMEEQYISSED